VPGVSGAPIMGDGRVALILDAAGLADIGKAELREAA
jgi:chemotaxis protein histidine kinase CheA